MNKVLKLREDVNKMQQDYMDKEQIYKKQIIDLVEDFNNRPSRPVKKII